MIGEIAAQQVDVLLANLAQHPSYCLVYEVMWMGQSFIKSDGLIWPMFYTGAFYLLFSGLLTLVFQRAEEKMNYYKD